MHHRRLLVRLGLGLFLIAGCSSVRVGSDYERGTQFGNLRTYAWRNAPPQGPMDPRLDVTLFGQRVRAAADRELAAKGYRSAQPGERPDFLIGYHAVLERKVDVPTVGRWYGYRGGPRTSGMVPYDYDQGTLLLDLIDPATNDLLWRGTATAVVDPAASAAGREQRINEAVAKILAQFPPPP